MNKQKKRWLIPLISLPIGTLLFLIIFTGTFGLKDTSRLLVKKSNSSKKNVASGLTPTASPTVTPTPTPTPIPVGLPNKVEIPKLKVTADVVPIGVTPNYAMDVPKRAADVGWFQDAVRPGQWGAAILVGHYDTPSGRPAIFYQLKSLAEGDEIIVHTNWNERFVFRVEKTLSQPYKTFPKDIVYGNFTGREIRLITCDGVWNRAERSYSKRLVIFAKLWEEQKT